MPGLRIFRRPHRHRVHHDVGRHIGGPILRDRASAERGRQHHQAAGPHVDRRDMDVRVGVLGRACAGSGLQPVRARGLPDQLQLRLSDGRAAREGVRVDVLRGRVVRPVRRHIVLLRENPNGRVGDQRDGRQSVRTGTRETQNRDPARVRGGRRHSAVVRVVDAIRGRGAAGGVRPEGVHHAAGLDGAGAVLQGGQLHGPVDIRHHASEIQERAGQAAGAEENAQTGTGLRREKRMDQR